MMFAILDQKRDEVQEAINAASCPLPPGSTLKDLIDQHQRLLTLTARLLRVEDLRVDYILSHREITLYRLRMSAVDGRDRRVLNDAIAYHRLKLQRIQQEVKQL